MMTTQGTNFLPRTVSLSRSVKAYSSNYDAELWVKSPTLSAKFEGEVRTSTHKLMTSKFALNYLIPEVNTLKAPYFLFLSLRLPQGCDGSLFPVFLSSYSTPCAKPLPHLTSSVISSFQIMQAFSVVEILVFA